MRVDMTPTSDSAERRFVKRPTAYILFIHLVCVLSRFRLFFSILFILLLFFQRTSNTSDPIITSKRRRSKLRNLQHVLITKQPLQPEIEIELDVVS